MSYDGDVTNGIPEPARVGHEVAHRSAAEFPDHVSVRDDEFNVIGDIPPRFPAPEEMVSILGFVKTSEGKDIRAKIMIVLSRLIAANGTPAMCPRQGRVGHFSNNLIEKGGECQ